MNVTVHDIPTYLRRDVSQKTMSWKTFFKYVAFATIIVISTFLLEMEVGYKWSMAHFQKVEAMTNKEICNKYLQNTVNVKGDKTEITVYCKSI